MFNPNNKKVGNTFHEVTENNDPFGEEFQRSAPLFNSGRNQPPKEDESFEEIKHKIYFNQEEMKRTLEHEILMAKIKVEQTMVDGYIGEDGFIHKETLNGGRMSSEATEDAEIDLKYAKQDAEIFDLLMNNYQAKNNNMAPYTIKKDDFIPIIKKFITDQTLHINQLLFESKALTKGTPEYKANEGKRRKLAAERSSAKRLKENYFNIPKTENPLAENDSGEDGQEIEKIPTGKTKEQIEMEESKKRRAKEALKRQVNDYWEQERQAEQKRREKNEHYQREKQQESNKIKEQKELEEEELEEEMWM